MTETVAFVQHEEEGFRDRDRESRVPQHLQGIDSLPSSRARVARRIGLYRGALYLSSPNTEGTFCCADRCLDVRAVEKCRQ